LYYARNNPSTGDRFERNLETIRSFSTGTHQILEHTEDVPPMDRSEALATLRQHLRQDSLVKHCLATEAIMRALAVRQGEDPDRWGLAGLLHDLDFESTKDEMARHGRATTEMLGDSIDADMSRAILAHNEMTGVLRQTAFEHALAAAESLTGMIAATALIYPDKKLASVKVSSVTKRMKEPAFARNVNRDTIRECEHFGMTVEQFVEVSLKAMQAIAADLGL